MARNNKQQNSKSKKNNNNNNKNNKNNKKKNNKQHHQKRNDDEGGELSIYDSKIREFEDGILDARKYLQSDDIKVDLDEEIDSDDVLGSDDDYDILNSKFSQTIRDKARKKKSGKNFSKNENEDEDEDEGYSSIDEGQLVTLSEAWDMDDRDLDETLGKKSKNDIVLNDTWETESSEDEMEEDNDDDSDNSSEESSLEEEEEESTDDEEEIFGNHDNDEEVDLLKTVNKLQSKIASKQPKERKKLIIETRQENEYNLPTGGNQLSLQDMMADINEDENNKAILLDKESKAIAIPLPKRIQQRNDRAAAYELSKKEISKWTDSVQALRQAEVLKFPMINQQQEDTIQDSALTFRSDNEPITELEKKINNVLTESSLVDDKKEAKFEEIAIAQMTPEEMKKRTNELRLMRELMFRDEKRAKRIKKIKSKQYHKIQKRERLKTQEMVENDEFNIDEDHDSKRAIERMSLKHKTQSQWAKSMIKSGLSKDSSNRVELEEMLRQGEKLRIKQMGFEDGDQSDEDIDDIINEYNQDDINHENKLKNKLGKGVMNMDFMKKAEARKREENLKELEMLKKLQNGEEGDLEIFKEDNGAVNIIKNQGRRIYTPTAAATAAAATAASSSQINDNINEQVLADVENDNAKSLNKRLAKKYQVIDNQETNASTSTSTSTSTQPEVLPVDESNPWLSANTSIDNDIMKKNNSTKITTIDKESSKLAKAAAKLVKSKLKKHKSNDENTLIDVNETLAINDIYQDNGSENENEGESIPTMFKQKDLIKQAFAGDDVISEFTNEKKRVIEEEDDKEEDLTLPGWGDWTGGDDLIKFKKKKFIHKIDGIMKKNHRKDKNLKNVIINEKVNKKNLKYQSSQIPYPFETREQYERSLRMPIGQEWTSKETHQKLTMPRIIVKQGTVIDPLKAPFK
ncbi:U3 small nucleolar RNA-associated protein, putative [Candida dubliniensis CD36]|uniref:U3 small nucleolar RNA-associated protein, putative n=1 Tax=Candida dubliniensis (strain CD36 / ATCC MYA-646 / CBS 7987 / NCPF 3949 / NRRL Y-17841) TaxID=573826 RepID=B9WMY7_CANDC|nr:U3 small nucleolar RNA-associated protein, putative [Candida dubliniensis CD36]CAX40453.1 U3 small nucleolar RNA-associated protein, putative [Candida dubliniensis CD36]